MIIILSVLDLQCTFSTDADALYKYGGGSGPIHYANFQCSGHETHLVDCSVGPQFFCFHFEDAGVRCSNSKLSSCA